MLMTCAMALAMCFPVAADNYIAAVPDSVRKLAYSDLESADPVTQQKILGAREQVIFSQSWVVEGRAYVTDSAGNITESPQFYDIFPEDWDVPVMDIDINACALNPRPVPAKIGQRSGVLNLLVDGQYLVPMASDIADARVVEQFNTSYRFGTYGEFESTYDRIDAMAHMWAPQSWTLNIGYTDMATGRSLAYTVNLGHQGLYTYEDPPANTEVGVRLSTYDHPTNWYIAIYGYSDGLVG